MHGGILIAVESLEKAGESRERRRKSEEKQDIGIVSKYLLQSFTNYRWQKINFTVEKLYNL